MCVDVGVEAAAGDDGEVVYYPKAGDLHQTLVVIEVVEEVVGVVPGDSVSGHGVPHAGPDHALADGIVVVAVGELLQHGILHCAHEHPAATNTFDSKYLSFISLSLSYPSFNTMTL